jgi:hypothetical protein
VKDFLFEVSFLKVSDFLSEKELEKFRRQKEKEKKVRALALSPKKKDHFWH